MFQRGEVRKQKRIVLPMWERIDWKKAVRILAVVLLSSTLVLFLTARSAQAKRQERESFKYYTSITIDAGDTLWSIAEEYYQSEATSSAYTDIRPYIDEIMNINGLSNQHQIKAGNALIVPYYSFVYNP